MIDEKLAFTPASELAELIATKQVSPVEVTQLYFDRIDKLNSSLNAYLTLTYDDAMKAAKAAEDAVTRGGELGPLHGVPISIKDLEMTKDVRTTSGSLVYKDRIPEEDSVVVERVKKSGAVILGKTNTPEFGLRGTTENRLGDACRNPWNTEHTPGGSSGGAGAAIVAGLCSLGTGSDGGGSIRIPASFCGIYGIKPTQGRIPRYSGRSAASVANQFSQSGPMSRTVRDSALLLQFLAGHDPRDPTSLREAVPNFVAAVDRDIRGLRIGFTPDYGFAAVDTEVAEVCSKAGAVFGELGCAVEDVDLKLDSPFEHFWPLFTANSYASNGYLLDTDADKLTDYGREALENGAGVTGAEYARELGYIDRLKAQFADAFDMYDLILSPTMAVPAFPIGQLPKRIAGREVDDWAYTPFTAAINMIGHPAASVPCGVSADDMPIGLHVIGRKGDEETVLAASAAFERARPWTQRRPKV
ncbi:MAG: amidase [Ardenticatenaceae bacterium]